MQVTLEPQDLEALRQGGGVCRLLLNAVWQTPTNQLIAVGTIEATIEAAERVHAQIASLLKPNV